MLGDVLIVRCGERRIELLVIFGANTINILKKSGIGIKDGSDKKIKESIFKNIIF